MIPNTATLSDEFLQFRRHLFYLFFALIIALMLLSPFSRVSAQAPNSQQTLPNSTAPWINGAQLVGHHRALDTLTIGLALQTSYQEEQYALLKAFYTPTSPLFHQWLQTGEFAARFAPARLLTKAAKSFLHSRGLRLLPDSPSSTLLLATGTTQQIEAAFHTTINDYRLTTGKQYFANSSNVQIPANLRNIIGVIGLSNITTYQPHMQPAQGQQPKLAPPYGGGPFGRGLTPSQIAGIYNATPVYQRLKTQGQGVTLGLYELSGYTRNDIEVYTKAFHLPSVPLVNKPILGGPIPVNRSVDDGAAEVELDIELQLAMTPRAKQVLVYNAPGNELGSLAEYLQIAKDNVADTVSTSWGIPCEYLVPTQDAQIENQAFVQMALQGQSLFSASGDAGAFGCTNAGLTLPQPLARQVADSTNPLVTVVGGTAFRQQNQGAVTFDPGHDPHPPYPGTSAERVWNEGCTLQDCVGGSGGVSRIWGSGNAVLDGSGKPLPGIVEAHASQYGVYCQQSPTTLCRETPDVSINSDPTTGYAIYCTNTAGGCQNPTYAVRGWSRFGGTSCGAPLWAGIAALYDSFHKGRVGLFTFYLYQFDSVSGFQKQFHDITQGDNGYYAAGPTYDLATGLGSPNVYLLIQSE